MESGAGLPPQPEVRPRRVKLTTGLAWGFVSGLVMGVLQFALAYPYLTHVARWTAELVYAQVTAQGVAPAQARQLADAAASITVPASAVGIVLVSGIVVMVIGLVMAYLWSRLRPWYLAGAVFGVVWTAINTALGLASAARAPSQLPPNVPPPPDPPAWLQPAVIALNFLTPLLAAYLIHLRAERR